jgi:hypothetical protein
MTPLWSLKKPRWPVCPTVAGTPTIVYVSKPVQAPTAGVAVAPINVKKYPLFDVAAETAPARVGSIS